MSFGAGLHFSRSEVLFLKVLDLWPKVLGYEPLAHQVLTLFSIANDTHLRCEFCKDQCCPQQKQYSAKSSTATRVRCLSGSDMYTARHGMQEGITFGLPGASWSGRWIGHTPTIQQEEAGWTVGTWRFSKATCIDSGGYGQVFKNMARAWDWEDVGLISRLGEVEISKSDAEMYITFSIVREGIFGWWWLMHISRDET